MNILHIIRDLDPSTGGPVSATVAIAEMQRRSGHSITILSVTRDKSSRQEINGVNIILIQSDYWKWRFSHKFYLEALTQIKNSDIVHIHTMWEYTTYISAKICTKQNKPYILRPCGMLDEWSMKQGGIIKRLYYSYFAKNIILRASQINFASSGEQESSQAYVGITPSFVLPNPINKVYQDYVSKESIKLDSVQEILFVGRIHPHKQIELIIGALKKVLEEGYKVKLVIAGDGNNSYKTELAKKIEDMNLHSTVNWLGALNAEELKKLYRKAICLVLPSMHENFGNVLSEAMSQACPVVVTKGVHIYKDVQASNSGLVVTDDSNSIAAAILYFLDNKKVHESMSSNALQYAIENYYGEQVNKNLMHQYKLAID